MKRFYYLLAALAFTATGFAQAIEDDIYYDGRKAEKQQAEQRGLQPKVTYATDDYMSSWQPSIESRRDVDEYNRYGSYYVSAIDTIGAGIADSEDFVYTQQIQKYYNPTIVADNSTILEDILNNSYGNINIIYGAAGPAFSSWYNLPYFEAYTPWGGFYSPLNWGWYTGWFDPWYRISAPWGYGWGWGWSAPGWGWGWNAPGWNYGWCSPGWGFNVPGCGWIWDLSPGRPGWSMRPENHRPATGVRPGWSRTSTLRNNHLSTNSNNRIHHNTNGINTGRQRGTGNNRGNNATLSTTTTNSRFGNHRLNNRTITTNRRPNREFMETVDPRTTTFTPAGGTGKNTGTVNAGTVNAGTSRTHGNFNGNGYLRQNRATVNNGSNASPRVSTGTNVRTYNGATNRNSYTSTPRSGSTTSRSNYSTQTRSNSTSTYNGGNNDRSSYSSGSYSSGRSSSSYSSGSAGGGHSSGGGRAGGGGGRSGGRR